MKRAIIKIFIQLLYIKTGKNLFIYKYENISYTFSRQKCIHTFLKDLMILFTSKDIM